MSSCEELLTRAPRGLGFCVITAASASTPASRLRRQRQTADDERVITAAQTGLPQIRSQTHAVLRYEPQHAESKKERDVRIQQ